MADRVLMIEDDRSLSEMLRQYLWPAGVEVTGRATASEGLAKLRPRESSATPQFPSSPTPRPTSTDPRSAADRH